MQRYGAGGDSSRAFYVSWQEIMSAVCKVDTWSARLRFGSSEQVMDPAPYEGTGMVRTISNDIASNIRLLRHHERYSVNIRALLHLRDRFQTTTIRDISIGGANLEGAFAVVPGDRIVLQLNNYRTLNAEVKWWACGRCGIAFERALTDSDPLLIEGATGRTPKLRVLKRQLAPAPARCV
jgi:PilZ domain